MRPARDAFMVVAFAVMHGWAWGTRGPLMQAIRADYFGTSHFGKIMGVSSLVVTVGNTTGPLVAGVLADRTGDYRAGFTVLAFGALLRGPLVGRRHGNTAMLRAVIDEPCQ